MNATTQTINTTQNFDIWWRDTGQFLQPCDAADADMREQFRLFASSMYADAQASIDVVKADAAQMETDMEKERDRWSFVKELLRDVLDCGITPESKVTEIQKILAEQ